MPFLKMPHTTMYYDFFSSDITQADATMTNETVLLVHGFAGTPASDFAPHLSALTQHYSVLAPHLHGYGLSSHRESYPVTYYREDVADLIALLDTLHLSHVLVLGFSDGAIVSLLLAALHPERVKALAVLGAQPAINGENVAAIRHWLLEKPLSAQWQQELAILHGEPYWRSLPALYVKAQEDLATAGGVLITDEELAAIRCPTLIMHGMRDRIVPVAYAHSLHQSIAHSQLLLFDAGHPAHLRHEQQYRDAVLQLFSSPSDFQV